MKKYKYLIAALLIVMVLAFPGIAQAADGGVQILEDQVIFGGSFTLRDGEVLDGSLIVFGGTVVIQEGALVKGDVVSFGGSVSVRGEVNGSLIVTGGSVSLGETAIIHGDLVAPGSSLSRDPDAIVEGQILTETGPITVDIPNIPAVPSIDLDNPPSFSIDLNPLGQIYWFMFRVFAFSALAVLLIMFVPNQADRASRAVIQQPVLSGGVGLVIALGSVMTFGLLMLTIILIPVSLLGFLLLGISILFGWISMGLEVGRRLAKALNQGWSAPIEAGFGTFALTFVLGGVDMVIPCLGFMAVFLVGAMGLGGVILTRFGSREYVGSSSSAVISPVKTEEDSTNDTAEVEPAEEEKPKPKPKAKSTPKPRKKAKSKESKE